MKSSIKRNLIVSYVIIIVLIMSLIAISSRGNVESGRLIAEINNEILPHTMDFLDLPAKCKGYSSASHDYICFPSRLRTG